MFKVFKLIAGFIVLAACLFSGYVMAQTVMIDGELFRDPTRPPSATTSAAAVTAAVDVGGPALALSNRLNYVVSFVRTGGSRPIAVINNTQLTIGDEIEGVRVVDIRNGEVVLAADGQEYVLSTYARSVREPVQ